MKKFLQQIIRPFDRFDHFWESNMGQRVLGTILVTSFLIFITLIELNYYGLLPDAISSALPVKRFAAIELSFTLLLIFEVISLILSLVYSVSASVGKQFEILSLILLRDTFKEISHFQYPLVWEQIEISLLPIIVTAIGALVIFIILGFYYKVHKKHQIIIIEKDRTSFIVAKKIISIYLFISFITILLVNSVTYLQGGKPEPVFETFFTILIFSDIFIMLISLRYGSSYRSAFRNSGFAISTVIIRLVFIAPLITGTLLGIGAALFVLVISLVYNNFTPSLYQQQKEEKEKISDN